MAGSGQFKGAKLKDLPKHFFPKKHPDDAGSRIEKMTMSAVFNLWHIAKKKHDAGTSNSQLAFLSNFQISLSAEANRAPNNLFVGEKPGHKLSRKPACGKGAADPVLEKPVTLTELNKIKFS
jgi:hypothetical protein